MYTQTNSYTLVSYVIIRLCIFYSSSDLSLDERLEYISRAVMCAKSCNLATSASKAGEVLHELEEKMEVCHPLVRIFQYQRPVSYYTLAKRTTQWLCLFVKIL